jgi:sialic acid synthase SpsE
MFNLTHNEDSAVDIGGVWVGPDEFELHFRFNNNNDDLEVFLALNHDELQTFVRYLDSKLVANKLRNM